MSMQYCHGCDTLIDTDFNAEHFPCVNYYKEIANYKNGNRLVENDGVLYLDTDAGLIKLEENPEEQPEDIEYINRLEVLMFKERKKLNDITINKSN